MFPLIKSCLRRPSSFSELQFVQFYYFSSLQKQIISALTQAFLISKCWFLWKCLSKCWRLQHHFNKLYQNKGSLPSLPCHFSLKVSFFQDHLTLTDWLIYLIPMHHFSTSEKGCTWRPFIMIWFFNMYFYFKFQMSILRDFFQFRSGKKNQSKQDLERVISWCISNELSQYLSVISN